MITVIINTFSALYHKLATFTASGRDGETLQDRRSWQHYGFASSPKNGCAGIVIQNGDHVIMIAEDDSRYRVELLDGEVALYDSNGSVIKLKNTGDIEVTANSGIMVTATSPVTINAPAVNVGDGSGKTLVTSDVLSLLMNHTHVVTNAIPATTAPVIAAASTALSSPLPLTGFKTIKTKAS
jgi:phage gp45-like